MKEFLSSFTNGLLKLRDSILDLEGPSTKVRLFCDGLPADVWKCCKNELRCLKCAKRYSDWRSLRKHMNFFCQMEPLFPCPYCSHRARIPTLLKYHLNRFGLMRQQLKVLEYADKSIFMCFKCGKNYARKASLQRHLQSTLCGTLSMFYCNFCRYRTNRKDVLVRHMRYIHLKTCVPAVKRRQ
ncbi:hypothetical protein ACFW04_005957 [Cataglyphis niger]